MAILHYTRARHRAGRTLSSYGLASALLRAEAFAEAADQIAPITDREQDAGGHAASSTHADGKRRLISERMSPQGSRDAPLFPDEIRSCHAQQPMAFPAPQAERPAPLAASGDAIVAENHAPPVQRIAGETFRLLNQAGIFRKDIGGTDRPAWPIPRVP